MHLQIILMGTLFTYVVKLLELPHLRENINIDLLLACLWKISVKIGDHCYHGLCDLGASVSAIPFSLYQEIKDKIAPAEIEGINVTIKLANRDTISPIEFLGMLKSCVGK